MVSFYGGTEKEGGGEKARLAGLGQLEHWLTGRGDRVPWSEQYLMKHTSHKT